MYLRRILIILLILLSPIVYSQSLNNENDSNKGVPNGFNEIKLGLDIESVKKLLKNDSNFLYRGDPDVSLLANENETLIECEGVSYIKRAFFQFHDKKLFTIILELDIKRIDHYSIYTNFSQKYGEPKSVSPSLIYWEDDNIQFRIERPLSIKYIDKVTFYEIKEDSKKGISLNEITRKKFIDQF